MPLLQTEEVHKRTDAILRNISEQYNPNLRNFIQAGRAYEKALAGVSYTSKAYFDGMAKLGMIARDSTSAKDLGESMRELAETLRQIQLHHEETVKFLNSEVFFPLENKLEHDTKYMLGVQKKYISDFRMKTEDLERVQLNHKKMKRKSYTGKKSYKYDEREKQLAEAAIVKQKALDQFQHDSLRQAFIEERRRYCFFVEQQCELAKRSIIYHQKAMETLSSQLSNWVDSCADVKNLPENASALLDMSRPDDSNSIYSIPDPPSEPAIQLNGIDHRTGSLNNRSPSVKSDDIANVYSTPNQSAPNVSNGHNVIPRENSFLPSLFVEKKRVSAVFGHPTPGSPTQLSFEQGDIIVLMIPQPRDGWHYGENDRTKQRGWFPYSYTKLVEQSNSPEKPAEPVKGQLPLPPADYNTASVESNGNAGSGPPPPQQAGPDPYKLMKDQFLMGNPFANVRLRKTSENNGDVNGNTEHFSTFRS